MTQLSILKDHMANGRHREAIRLAASWRRLGDAHEAISRAAAALTSPEIYRQMGYDPVKTVEDGLEAIRRRYKLN